MLCARKGRVFIDIINTQKTYTRWPYLVVGVFAMIFVGVLYIWSIMKAPLAAEFGWTTAELTLNYTLSLCFFCLGAVAGGVLTNKAGHRVTIVIAGVLSCAGFLLVSLLSGESLLMLYIINGVVGGLGVGISYNVVITSVVAWFPDKQGTCSGVLMMGMGASGLVLGSLAEALIAAVGWRYTFSILGIALGVVMIAAGIIIRCPPHDAAFPHPKASAQSLYDVKDYSPGQMLRMLPFWCAYISVTFTAATGNSVISFAKELSLSVGATAALPTALVGIVSICNGIGRFFSGVLYDFLGRRKTMLLVNAVAIAASVFLIIAVLNSMLSMCVAGMCLAGLSYGGCATSNAAFIAAPYGRKHYSVNFGIASSTIMGAALASYASGNLITNTGSYVGPFSLLLGLAVVAIALTFSIKRS